MVTRHTLRLIETGEEIAHQLPDQQEKAFLARQLVQATLPHRAPKGTPPEWARCNGDFSLSIRPGYKTDPKTGQRVCIGYPYGNIPRLLMFWITTEALRTGNRRLELGDTLSAFMRQLGLNPRTGTGSRSDVTRLRDQMDRLFTSAIMFRTDKPTHSMTINITITENQLLWWDPKDPDQPTLFGSWLQLNDTFYKTITESPVPVDLKALRALKNSPLALDLYAWASFKTFIAAKTNKPQHVPWKALQMQIGGDYSRQRAFREAVINALHKVSVVFPGLVLDSDDNGLIIKPGRPAILPK